MLTISNELPPLVQPISLEKYLNENKLFFLKLYIIIYDLLILRFIESG